MTPTDLRALRDIAARAADQKTYGAESVRRDLAFRAALTPTVAVEIIDSLIRASEACRCAAGMTPDESSP